MKAFGIPWPEFNQGLFYADTVKHAPSLPTLIEFYSSRYKSSAPTKGWLQRIHNGQITIDGSVVTDPDMVLRIGSKLVYHRLPWREPLAPYEVGILFEDDQLLIVNKPSGLQVLPGGLFQERTLLTQLQWSIDKSAEYGPEGNRTVNTLQESYPVPVHRLGRGTSAILLCAKTNVAKSKLAADFADGTDSMGRNRCSGTDLCDVKRRISKTYRALAKGIIQQDKILIQQPIGKIEYPGVGGGLYAASSTGKPSESRIAVVSRDENRNCTLVEVEIYSGRPHQIRIHLSYIGHPLVGDPLYVADGRPLISLPENYSERYDVENFADDGGYERPLNALPGDCGYHLHASRLFFQHPTRDEGARQRGGSIVRKELGIGTSPSGGKWDIQIYAPSPPMLRTPEENARIDDEF